MIRGATCDTCAVGVESDWIYTSIMILEGVNACLRCDVPELHSLVFRGRCNQSWVWSEFCSQDPIVVCIDGEHELSVTQLEDLEHSVVRTRKKKWAVVIKWDSLNWCRVRFDYIGEAFDWIIPNSHCLISWAWHNLLAIRWYCNSVDRPFMTDEPEWTHLRLEIPNHDRTVHRSTNSLLEVWIEYRWHHAVFVTFKRSLKSWIGDVSWQYICSILETANRGRGCLMAFHFDLKSKLIDITLNFESMPFKRGWFKLLQNKFKFE